MSDSRPLVVGIDRSAESAAALTHALAVAAALDRPLAVVHAVGLLEEAGYRPEPEVDELVAAAHRAVPDGDDVDVTVVREDGPAADVILRVAERLDADTIVVGRRGLGEAPRPLGSVSEALLARSHVPVLVVPAG
jgi:nucleotide-binding universal stress UspA family protein